METPLNQPPMNMQNVSMDDGTIPVDGQMPMDDDDDETVNPYDTNFDAGIDTDENEDPKRYIQQLTGKLSQSLRKYQQELPSPDADLDKYVAGMILKQTTDGLDDKDVDEVLGKLKDDEDDTNESIDRDSVLNELFQELSDSPDDEDNSMKIAKVKNKGNYRKLPFTSPKFD